MLYGSKNGSTAALASPNSIICIIYIWLCLKGNLRLICPGLLRIIFVFLHGKVKDQSVSSILFIKIEAFLAPELSMRMRSMSKLLFFSFRILLASSVPKLCRWRANSLYSKRTCLTGWFPCLHSHLPTSISCTLRWNRNFWRSIFPVCIYSTSKLTSLLNPIWSLVIPLLGDGCSLYKIGCTKSPTRSELSLCRRHDHRVWGKSRWYWLFGLLQTCCCFLDLYIKQHRGFHALSIGLPKHPARTVPSLTHFSLLDAETFDEDCYSGSGPSRGKRFGHVEAYNRLVRSRIVYRCRITESELFRDRTWRSDWV